MKGKVVVDERVGERQLGREQFQISTYVVPAGANAFRTNNLNGTRMASTTVYPWSGQ